MTRERFIELMQSASSGDEASVDELYDAFPEFCRALLLSRTVVGLLEESLGISEGTWRLLIGAERAQLSRVRNGEAWAGFTIALPKEVRRAHGVN